MSDNSTISLYDSRPFFEKALHFGAQNGIIDTDRINAILNDAPKGMIQIADFFGSQYLRPDVESAQTRMVNLVSLYLEEKSGGDLTQAAHSLRDHTFLSHSRGGSELLKKLFALPEDAIIGSHRSAELKDFLEKWSLLTPAAYRKERKKRIAAQDEIAAAIWLAEQSGMRASALEDEAAELVIRSAILLRMSGSQTVALPNAGEFAQLIDTLRTKGIAAAATKRARVIAADMPEQYQLIVERMRRKIVKTDLPEILDPATTLAALLNQLKQKYYLRTEDPDDVSNFDAIVAKDWVRVTEGKSDSDSLLTLFLCLAAGAPPNIKLSEKAARDIVRNIRDEGIRPERVPAFIHQFAPFEMREDLIALWEDFFNEAEKYLLDDWDTKFLQVLSFLQDNCNIVKKS
ncbi:hypothetical protein [Herminiimonas sp. CN]|uniref:hypothetical protein n=1 Tax=Herminiimonas sp. CN TaxID=1349818 RepID=UPI0004734771|nr:hypothetical protein [Herminiimonas sp. CN]